MGDFIPANCLCVVGVFDFKASKIFEPASLSNKSMLMVWSESTVTLGASSLTVLVPMVKGEARANTRRLRIITREIMIYFETPLRIAYHPASAIGLMSKITRGYWNSITIHPSSAGNKAQEKQGTCQPL